MLDGADKSQSVGESVMPQGTGQKSRDTIRQRVGRLLGVSSELCPTPRDAEWEDMICGGGKPLRIVSNPHGPITVDNKILGVIWTETTVNRLKPYDRVIPLTRTRLPIAIHDLTVAAKIVRPAEKPTKQLIWPS